ncbi:UNVERIFIED_CONTAM: hypothetical protein HHA_217688 [Hammondia hammondi]|eukprot:XP_008889276.1 hypothetical protein HHA_217688 [Hammondia hammondi]
MDDLTPPRDCLRHNPLLSSSGCSSPLPATLSSLCFSCLPSSRPLPRLKRRQAWSLSASALCRRPSSCRESGYASETRDACTRSSCSSASRFSILRRRSSAQLWPCVSPAEEQTALEAKTPSFGRPKPQERTRPTVRVSRDVLRAPVDQQAGHSDRRLWTFSLSPTRTRQRPRPPSPVLPGGPDYEVAAKSFGSDKSIGTTNQPGFSAEGWISPSRRRQLLQVLDRSGPAAADPRRDFDAVSSSASFHPRPIRQCMDLERSGGVRQRRVDRSDLRRSDAGPQSLTRSEALFSSESEPLSSPRVDLCPCCFVSSPFAFSLPCFRDSCVYPAFDGALIPPSSADCTHASCPASSVLGPSLPCRRNRFSNSSCCHHPSGVLRCCMDSAAQRSAPPFFMSVPVHAMLFPRQDSGDMPGGSGEVAVSQVRRRSRDGYTLSALNVPGDRAKSTSAGDDDKATALRSNGTTSWRGADGSSVSTKVGPSRGFTESQTPVTQYSTEDQGERGTGCAVIGSKYPDFYEDDDDDGVFIPRPGEAFLASRGPEIARGQASFISGNMRFCLDDSPPLVLQKPRAKEQPKSSKLKSFFNFSIKGAADKKGTPQKRSASDYSGGPQTMGSVSVGLRDFGTNGDANLPDGGFGSFSHDSPEDHTLYTGLSMHSCVSISDDDSEPTHSHRSRSHGDKRRSHRDIRDHSADSCSSTRSSVRGDEANSAYRRKSLARKEHSLGRREGGKQADTDEEGECPCSCCCCCCCCCGPAAEESRETIQVKHTKTSTYAVTKRPSRRRGTRR